jgi:hypothetical protein
MKTKDHGFKDLNEISSLSELDTRNIVGSIRLILERIVLKKESDKMVEKFIKYKFHH